MRSKRFLTYVHLGISALVLVFSSSRATWALESPWVASREAKTRLISASTRLAFIEIELAPGWKTYWRTPGDAGGLPPAFDWSASSNLASADVLYPAPSRLRDRSGDTIGYKGGVIFPVKIEPADEAKPVSLKLAMQFGICKEICVPVEVNLEIEIAPGETEAVPQSALDALARVPRPESRRAKDDPVLVATKVDLASAAPRITLEAKFPESSDPRDIFLEAPDGLYVPLPVMKADRDGGLATFEVDLSAGADVEALKGKTLTATLVSPRGASVAKFRLE